MESGFACFGKETSPILMRFNWNSRFEAFLWSILTLWA
ncbi:hypothetical protein DO71_6096 [Burkholderia pseudomallei]|nr:hypothetical protein DO71_6096 [Burkholderia pseudomallei]KOS89575.1 hypothetical protein DM53_3567 [Burkholderia mallei]